MATEQGKVAEARLSSVGPVGDMVRLGEPESAARKATAPVTEFECSTQRGRDGAGAAADVEWFAGISSILGASGCVAAGLVVDIRPAISATILPVGPNAGLGITPLIAGAAEGGAGRIPLMAPSVRRSLVLSFHRAPLPEPLGSRWRAPEQ